MTDKQKAIIMDSIEFYKEHLDINVEFNANTISLLEKILKNYTEE